MIAYLPFFFKYKAKANRALLVPTTLALPFLLGDAFHQRRLTGAAQAGKPRKQQAGDGWFHSIFLSGDLHRLIIDRYQPTGSLYASISWSS